MDELLAFLRACVAEDEQTARNATPGTWKLWAMQVRADINGTGNLDTSLPVAATHHEHGSRTWNADHIARHDPRRALRQVDAMRELMAEHHPFLGTQGGVQVEACRRCSDLRPDTDPVSRDGRWAKLEPAPCRTLRLLAAIFADYPGYRDEWRPRPAST